MSKLSSLLCFHLLYCAFIFSSLLCFHLLFSTVLSSSLLYSAFIFSSLLCFHLLFSTVLSSSLLCFHLLYVKTLWHILTFLLSRCTLALLSPLLYSILIHYCFLLLFSFHFCATNFFSSLFFSFSYVFTVDVNDAGRGVVWEEVSHAVEQSRVE